MFVRITLCYFQTVVKGELWQVKCIYPRLLALASPLQNDPFLEAKIILSNPLPENISQMTTMCDLSFERY